MTGQKLASPQAVVAHTAPRPRRTVAGDGGSTRDLAVLTGPGPWYRIGEDLVEVRWGHVQDGSGTHRDADFLTTDITLRPQPLVEC